MKQYQTNFELSNEKASDDDIDSKININQLFLLKLLASHFISFYG